MNAKNLLPAHRQTSLRRRRAARRWIVLNSAYLGLLIVAGTAYAVAMLTHERPAPESADVAALNNTLVGLRQQTAALNTNWRAVQQITQRPDWSVLMAVMANALGDQVILTSIEGPPPAEPANPLADPHRVRLSAVATSQAAVSDYVLRLEALKLFSRVQLEKTATQATRGGHGVRFQLVCNLIEEAPR